jgi:cardiolipin synthase
MQWRPCIAPLLFRRTGRCLQPTRQFPWRALPQGSSYASATGPPGEHTRPESARLPAATDPPAVSPLNIPNALTFSRIVGTPLVIHWINQGEFKLVLCSFAAFAFTDFLDGHLARKWGQITAIGSFMDPLADKILVNGMMVPLAAAALVPWPLVALFLGRDVAIIAGVMYSRALTIEGKLTVKNFVAVGNSTPQNLKPTNISKVNTLLQCTMIVVAVARAADVLPELMQPDQAELAWNALVVSTALTTAWSWADYFNHFINGNRNWMKSLEKPNEAAADAATRLVKGKDQGS